MSEHRAAAPAVVWFRHDLRLSDNPALAAAVATGRPVLPVFVLEEDDPWPPGGAARWWLHHALERLGGAIGRAGATLVLRRGPAETVIPDLVRACGAAAVFWNRRYDPAGVARDTRLKRTLVDGGVRVESFNAALLREPWEVKTRAGGHFRVFTPFWRACLALPEPPAPCPAPDAIPGVADPPPGDSLAGWGLLPTAPDWAGGLRAEWEPGEAAARRRLGEFLDGPLARYGDDRNRPDRDGTSRLSPHLRFGEIGPRQIWHAARAAADGRPESAAGAGCLLREVGWREFSAHLLYHVPTLPEAPLDPRFAGFPWREDAPALRRWRRGLTGYPVVDAGMRQVWQTGWMHNRVRMIAASFLIKDLLVPWQVGQAWFWDTLVDADLANNAASWQWVAGCGADAAPFFRIFNPVLQGETFDPDGAYVRRFVPELSGLPAAWIHKPWQAPADILRRAGVAIGHDYPAPVVEHRAARDRALAIFEQVKGGGGARPE